MNYFLILDEMTDLCSNDLIKAAVGTVKTIFTIIQFVVPAVLIILCGIDMFKAMTSGDEKKTKETQKTCIRRLIYALIVFLIIPILSLIMSAVGSVVKIKEAGTAGATFQNFLSCWDKAGETVSVDNNNNDDVASGSCTCSYYDNGQMYDQGYMDRDACESQRGHFCRD